MIETTPTTSLDQCAHVVEELTVRGLLGAEHLVDQLSINLDGIERTIAYFDAQRGRKTPGLLVHLLRSGEAAGFEPAGKLSSSSDRYRMLEARMIADGFSERQAPYAVMAVLTRPAFLGTVGRLRAYLMDAYPELFDE